MSKGRYSHLRNKREAKAFYQAVSGGGTSDKAGEDGTPNGTGVTAKSNPGAREIVLNFKNTAIALVDAAAVGARAVLKVYDFPAGAIVLTGAVADLTVGKSSAGVNATWNGDFSVGSVAAAADATLTATEANVIASTAVGPAVAGNATAKGKSAAEVRLDGTATAVDLYLNLLVDDADQDVTTTPCNLIVNGTLTFTYANLGDN